MTQGVFPYKYEEEKTISGMTSLAGLPIYLDLASVLNLGESIATHLHAKAQGSDGRADRHVPYPPQPRRRGIG